jgi:hypothetical protein
MIIPFNYCCSSNGKFISDCISNQSIGCSGHANISLADLAKNSRAIEQKHYCFNIFVSHTPIL